MQKSLDGRVAIGALVAVALVVVFLLYRAAAGKSSYPGAISGAGGGLPGVQDMQHMTPEQMTRMRAMFSGQQRQELQKAGLADQPQHPGQ